MSDTHDRPPLTPERLERGFRIAALRLLTSDYLMESQYTQFAIDDEHVNFVALPVENNPAYRIDVRVTVVAYPIEATPAPAAPTSPPGSRSSGCL